MGAVGSLAGLLRGVGGAGAHEVVGPNQKKNAYCASVSMQMTSAVAT